jgi:hypothetical protein
MYVYIYIHTYIDITRLASNEIFSPSNKINLEVGWAKDLSAHISLYIQVFMVCFEHSSYLWVSAVTTAPSNLRETYLTVPGSILINKKDAGNERRILYVLHLMPYWVLR